MRKKTVAKRLKQIMKDRHIRQRDILNLARPYCEQFGVEISTGSLSQYVSGAASPSIEKLYILALCLDVDEGWLLGYTVPQERREPGNNLPPEDSERITALYDALNDEGQKKAEDYLVDLVESGRYAKD